MRLEKETGFTDEDETRIIIVFEYLIAQDTINCFPIVISNLVMVSSDMFSVPRRILDTYCCVQLSLSAIALCVIFSCFM